MQCTPDFAPWGTDTTWELLTSLYGLKEASARYYDTISKVIMTFTDDSNRKFRRNAYDACCFTKGKLVRGFDESGNSNTTGFTCFSMHVDDKFLGVSSLQELAEFENMLKTANIQYTLTPLNQMLGVRIKYVKYKPGESGTGTMVLDHDQYIEDSFKEIRSSPLIDQSKTSPLNIPMNDSDMKLMLDQPEPTFDKARYSLF